MWRGVQAFGAHKGFRGLGLVKSSRDRAFLNPLYGASYGLFSGCPVLGNATVTTYLLPTKMLSSAR